MGLRRDAGLAAAGRGAARSSGWPSSPAASATTGSIELEPGIPTAVAGRAELIVDLRHAEDAESLELDAAAARDGGRREAAAARGCELARASGSGGSSRSAFDELAWSRALPRSPAAPPLTSGALHDAAEMARVLPAAMLFVPLDGAASATPRRRTPRRRTSSAGIEAFGELAGRVAQRGDHELLEELGERLGGVVPGDARPP